MRLLSLLLIALLLASISHQDVVTFGEFVGGAHEAPRGRGALPPVKLRLVGSSLPDVKKFVQSNNLFITTPFPGGLDYDGPCQKISLFTSTWDSPKITRKACKGPAASVDPKIVSFLRDQPVTAINIQDVKLNGFYKIKTQKGFLVLRRVA